MQCQCYCEHVFPQLFLSHHDTLSMLQILHLDAKMALVKAQYKELAAEALKNTKNKTLADVTNAARKGSVHKPATIGIASSFTPARICNSYTPGSLAGSSAARSARSMTHTPQFVPVQPVQPVQPVELALPLAEQVSPVLKTITLNSVFEVAADEEWSLLWHPPPMHWQRRQVCLIVSLSCSTSLTSRLSGSLILSGFTLAHPKSRPKKYVIQL